MRHTQLHESIIIAIITITLSAIISFIVAKNQTKEIVKELKK